MEHVAVFIDKELSLGTLLGPFDSDPFYPCTKTSPLMTRPKKQENARRIIVDLSHPPLESVNAGIIKNFFQGAPSQYTLPSVSSIISLVQEAGQRALIWSADLSRAYRQLHVDPLDYCLSGIKYKEKIYIDKSPSFGCRSSAGHMQRVSHAISYMMAQRGHHMLAYIDDYASVSTTKEQADSSLLCLETLTRNLGIDLAPEKTIRPTTSLVWLGYHIDTQKMRVSIPKPKLDEVLQECKEWQSTKTATRKDIQKLVGKLFFIANCLAPARRFLARILATLRASPLKGSITIGEEFKKDLRWFILHGHSTNGIHLIPDGPRPIWVLEGDSCMEGGGA